MIIKQHFKTEETSIMTKKIELSFALDKKDILYLNSLSNLALDRFFATIIHLRSKGLSSPEIAYELNIKLSTYCYIKATDNRLLLLESAINASKLN